ncbi:MAG TPA: zinc-ribbon domain-containing protein, partial [Polyangiaceae bacterium]
MNVTCTACPAKYSVPDEKVRGKKVKITCKHCGTGIVVDGTGLGPGPAPKDALTSLGPVLPGSTLGAPTAPAAVIVPPTEPQAGATSGEPTWMIGFPDDHQEQHTTSELVALYKAGTIDDECFVWRDGMNDWLSPFDVPEVADALKSAGLSRRSAQAPLNDEEDEATRVAPSPFDMEAPEPPAPAPAPVEAKPAFVSPAAAKPWAKAATEPKGATQPKLAATPKPSPADAPRAAVQPKPVAARRAAADRGAIDLFGAVDDAAGSEEDVAPNVAADEHAQKMTGARNESSVLFSLDQLTKLDKPKPKDKKKA